MSNIPKKELEKLEEVLTKTIFKMILMIKIAIDPSKIEANYFPNSLTFLFLMGL